MWNHPKGLEPPQGFVCGGIPRTIDNSSSHGEESVLRCFFIKSKLSEVGWTKLIRGVNRACGDPCARFNHVTLWICFNQGFYVLVRDRMNGIEWSSCQRNEPTMPMRQQRETL